MTIAVGMMATDGIVLAPDTQETEGYFKGFSLKTASVQMVHADEESVRDEKPQVIHSALGVTGAGPSVFPCGPCRIENAQKAPQRPPVYDERTAQQVVQDAMTLVNAVDSSQTKSALGAAFENSVVVETPDK